MVENGTNGHSHVHKKNGTIDVNHFMDKYQGNKCTVVLGAQWGDEGKGKLVDLLATNSDVVCRCQVSYDKVENKFINIQSTIHLLN